jgi:hypothetical protein
MGSVFGIAAAIALMTMPALAADLAPRQIAELTIAAKTCERHNAREPGFEACAILLQTYRGIMREQEIGAYAKAKTKDQEIVAHFAHDFLGNGN